MKKLEAAFIQSMTGFLAGVLADPDNQVIATYSRPGLDQETAQAPLETTRRIFNNPDSRAALSNLQESVFYDLDGRRLVCRPLRVQGKIYLLIILVPSGNTYRRAVNRLVTELEAVLKKSTD